LTWMPFLCFSKASAVAPAARTRGALGRREASTPPSAVAVRMASALGGWPGRGAESVGMPSEAVLIRELMMMLVHHAEHGKMHLTAEARSA